jgi:hypothetical protein
LKLTRKGYKFKIETVKPGSGEQKKKEHNPNPPKEPKEKEVGKGK